MRVAVTYEDGEISQRFGRTPSFKLYEVSNGEIESTEVVPVAGGGHLALTNVLVSRGVDVLICGGLGAPAAEAVKQAGIELYAGKSGSADEAVTRLAAGELEQDEEANRGHRHRHDHGEGCLG